MDIEPKPLRILLAVHHYPPAYKGGAEWRASRTASSLAQHGHQVRVLTVDSITHGDGQSIESRDSTDDGIPVRRLSFNLKRASESVRWEFRNPLVAGKLQSMLEAFRPDVLHLISGYLLSGSVVEVAREQGVPVVLTLTDFWFVCPRITLLRPSGENCTVPEDTLECAVCLRHGRRRYRLTSRATGGLSDWLLKTSPGLRLTGSTHLVQALAEWRGYLLRMLNNVDVAISPSRFLKDVMAEQDAQPGRYMYMRQGVNMDNWVEATPGPPPPPLRIGYVGQLGAHKGVDVLIRAVTQLKCDGSAAQLVIYGDEGQFPRYARKLRRLANGDERITFAGTFPNQDVRRVHAGLHVLVVPSIWYENSPNVILEAFANGTPVIASRLGGMAELVQHGVNGLHFQAGQASDLAKQLEKLVADPSELSRLRAGVPPVKTADQEIEELIDVYRSMQRE